MNCKIVKVTLITVVFSLISGCFGHRHKSYTFDQKYDYYSGKVLKHIRKIVSDQGKLDRISEKLSAHKDGLRSISGEIKNEKTALKDLLLAAKDKEEIKNKINSLKDKNGTKYLTLVDILFEIKKDLSEEEWKKVAAEFNKNCSHWWK